MELYDYNAYITLNPCEELHLRINGGYHQDWYGMPAGLSRTQIDQIGRTGSTTPYDWAKTETGFYKFSPKVILTTDGPDSSLDLDIWYRKRRSTSETHWTGGLSRDSGLKDHSDLDRPRIQKRKTAQALLKKAHVFGNFPRISLHL